MSELTNEQLLELIESIKEKNGGETNARNWSKEDIDRLLELTDRGKQLEELDRETETEENSVPAPEIEKTAEEDAVAENNDVEVDEDKEAFPCP